MATQAEIEALIQEMIPITHERAKEISKGVELGYLRYTCDILSLKAFDRSDHQGMRDMLEAWIKAKQ